MNYQDMKDFLSKMSYRTLLLIHMGMLQDIVDAGDIFERDELQEASFPVFFIIREIVEENFL